MSRNSLILIALIAVMATPACKKSGSASDVTSATPAQSQSIVEVQSPVVDAPVVKNPDPGKVRTRTAGVSANVRNDYLWKIAQRAVKTGNLGEICTRGYQGGMKQAASVSHYYIAPGAKVGDYTCKSGFAYFGQPELAGTCLHPCRTLAADPRFHRPGEVIFFKDLVGMKCGSGRTQMIHDGFMVVADNGNPESINVEGRFGVFWGRCMSDDNGFCRDQGATALDFALTFSPYCRAWRPADPLFNSDIKLEMYNRVRSEAVRRGDSHAASAFDLDDWIGLSVDSTGVLYRRSSN